MNNVLELRQLWDIIRKHFFAIFFMALIGAGIGFGIAKFLIAPTYSASTSMLVNRSTDNTQSGVNLSDQQADVQIINTWQIARIIRTPHVSERLFVVIAS